MLVGCPQARFLVAAILPGVLVTAARLLHLSSGISMQEDDARHMLRCVDFGGTLCLGYQHGQHESGMPVDSAAAVVGSGPTTCDSRLKALLRAARLSASSSVFTLSLSTLATPSLVAPATNLLRT